jgi:DNA-binding transcriptional ArsR family regulator
MGRSSSRSEFAETENRKSVSAIVLPLQSTPRESAGPGWTFLSNHAHVLICLARNPGAVLREVADQVGITERSVRNILDDLEEAGFVLREREGRRNRYVLALDLPLRHPLEAHRSIGDLLAAVLLPAERALIGLPDPDSSDPAGDSR